MEPVFAPPPRYQLRGIVGAGGMGVVYRAWDQLRQEEVALKTLHHLDPGALYRFKQEFRGLADVVHENLVALHDMAACPGGWFFSMELVEGVDLLTWVGRSSTVEGGTTMRTPNRSPRVSQALGPGVDQETTLDRPPFTLDEGRLREALRQLARGVAALHRAGKLHRDIKPSNVLVTPRGRVVLLDFGLIADLDPLRFSLDTDPVIVGTAGYMAPEQCAPDPLTPAADWYGFGALLFEALTGRLPFTGRPLEILLAKQRDEPPPVDSLTDGIPPDLAALAGALLRRDPAARPDEQTILARLGASAEECAARPPAALPLVGRLDEQALFERAYRDMLAGRAVTVWVHGPSGIGKSALVRHVLDGLERAGRDPLLLLDGRCYERESVPYKALDAVVDRLTQHLLRLPAEALPPLLPVDVRLLAGAFPVLDRLDAVAGAPPPPAIPDPGERRRRTSRALRDLLDRVARTRPLVLFIDDLHWGDVDSAALLLDLFTPPAPPLLLVVCLRSEDLPTSPLLGQLFRDGRWAGGGEAHEIRLGPLGDDDGQRLAALSLGERADGALVQAVAREASGSPFFIGEIARHLLGRGDRGLLEVASLEDVVADRLALLDDGSRGLLEAVALSRGPLEEALALRAAGVLSESLTRLRAAHLVVIRSTEGATVIEASHDRIRLAALARLDEAQRRRLHLSLAEALSREAEPDPLRLLEHYVGADERDLARHYSVIAAEQAMAALAFDRAAELLRRAVSLLPAGGAGAGLRGRLAEALAFSGRGDEAGEEYLAASRELGALSPNHPDVLVFQRAAAEQLLRAGSLDRGVATLRATLESFAVPLARSPGRAITSLLLHRLRLRLRGLDYQRRERSAIDERDLLRLDACRGAAAPLGMVDPLLAADLNTRHLLDALQVGDEPSVFRALCHEASYLATVGTGSTLRRAREISARIDRLAAAGDDPLNRAWARVAAANLAFFSADWRTCLRLYDEAEQLLRERCRGVSWEIASAASFSTLALVHLGRLDELARRLPRILREADARGDVYGAAQARLGYRTLAWLAADRPLQAEELAEEAIARWPGRRFSIIHYNHLTSQVLIDLYRGEPRRALTRLDEARPGIEQSHLLRVKLVRVDLLHLRARAAISLASSAGDTGSRSRAQLLRRVDDDAQQIAGEGQAWCGPIAAQLRAAACHLRGERHRALPLLGQAAAGFAEVGMVLHGAACDLRRLALGEPGEAALAQARRPFRSAGIVDPDRFTELLAPGLCPSPLRG